MGESANKAFNNFRNIFGGRRLLSNSCATEAARKVGSKFDEVVDAAEAEKKATMKEVHDRRAVLSECMSKSRGIPQKQMECMSSVWGNKEAAVEVEEKLLAERERKEKKDLENLIQGLIGSKKS